MSEDKDRIDEAGKKMVDTPFSWAVDISGRLVTFPDPEGMGWGVELTIPLNNEGVRYRLQYSGIKLPDTIRNIRFLDLAPQETLPRKLRTIRTDRPFYAPTLLSSLARKTVSSSKTVEKLSRAFNAPRPADMVREDRLGQIISDIFGSNKTEIKDFNSLLEKSKGACILIVCSHGGDTFELGEQYSDQVVDSSEKPIQRMGNRIRLEEVLEKYDDPETYAAILIHSCYVGNEKIVAKGVPVVRAIGHVGGFESAVLARNPTEISIPKR